MGYLGHLEEAVGSFQRALDVKPDFSVAFSNLLFTKGYLSDESPDDLLLEAMKCGALIRQQCATFRVDRSFSNPSRGRRLRRIGFVSPDWGNHPVGYFTLDVFRHLTPLLADKSVEIVFYSNRKPAMDDEITRHFQELKAVWRCVAYLPDAQLAQRIREDEIDILVDLSGHTRDHRLGVFAARSAPVQMTWLGYLPTTGLSEIDWLLGDSYVTPVEEEDHFAENIWRMPDSYLCFSAPDFDLAVSAFRRRRTDL